MQAHGPARRGDRPPTLPQALAGRARGTSAALAGLAGSGIPERRGHGLAEVLEHQVEGNADAFALPVVGGHRVLQPRREDQQAAFLALGIGAVGGQPRVLTWLGHDHRRLAARILEQDQRARCRHRHVVDAAQIVVRMMVHRVIGARRIDVGPAARDGHRVLIDLQEARDTACGRFDQLGELGKGRPRVQVLRRLPVAARRNGRTRRDQPLDLGFQLGVQRRRGGGLEIHDPQRGREEFLDVLLLDHAGRSYPATPAKSPPGRGTTACPSSHPRC